MGLCVEPTEPGAGVSLTLDVELVTIPLYIYKTREQFAERMAGYVRDALREGLYGWQVTDCVVTMTQCVYAIPDGPPSRRGRSAAADFRKLTPLVVRQALNAAGAVVCEPVVRARLEAPAAVVGALLAAVGRLAGTVEGRRSPTTWRRLKRRSRPPAHDRSASCPVSRTAKASSSPSSPATARCTGRRTRFEAPHEAEPRIGAAPYQAASISGARLAAKRRAIIAECGSTFTATCSTAAAEEKLGARRATRRRWTRPGRSELTPEVREDLGPLPLFVGIDPGYDNGFRSRVSTFSACPSSSVTS
jgi:hypothetical protein